MSHITAVCMAIAPWETESCPSQSFCDRNCLLAPKFVMFEFLRRLFLYLGLQQDAEQLGYQWGVVCLSTLREVICLWRGDVSPLWHATLFFFLQTTLVRYLDSKYLSFFIFRLNVQRPVRVFPKGIIVRVLNTAPRHEDMLGCGKATCILELQHSMEVLGQLRVSK